MDKIRVMIEKLADWINRTTEPPLIYAGYQQVMSRNPPAPILGLVYQDGAVCDGWTLGDTRHPFPPNHLALVSTHRGSRASEIHGRGGLWVCSFQTDGWAGYADLLRQYRWAPQPIHSPARLCQAYWEVTFRFLAQGQRQGLPPPYRLRGRAFQLSLKASLLQFFAVVLEELGESGGMAASPPGPNVEKAARFLHASYRQPRMTLVAVARAVGLSPHHFGRVFRREMGVPPMKYLRQVRITQSQNLLATDNLRVGEVAREVGFSDPLHFSRVFRQTTGLSPRQFQARQRRARTSQRARS